MVFDVLDALREEFTEGRRSKKGTTCPCCDRFAKTYKYRLDLSTARSLVWLYWASQSSALKGESEWVDVVGTAPRWVIRSRRLTKAKYWGFVEQHPVVKGGDKKCSGTWRCTARGEEVVQGSPFSKFAYVYNDKAELFSAETETLADVVKGFSYHELMTTGVPISWD